MSKSSFRMEKTQFDEKAISYKLSSSSFFLLGGGGLCFVTPAKELVFCYPSEGARTTHMRGDENSHMQGNGNGHMQRETTYTRRVNSNSHNFSFSFFLGKELTQVKTY